MKLLIRFLARALMLYAVVMVAMFAFQRQLMYHPNAEPMAAPASMGLPQARALTLTAADGTKLAAWLIPPQADKPLIVFFHGNAQNLAARVNKLRAFSTSGMGVLALSYRGFGGSEGTPTEAGIYDDARATLAYARETLQLPPERIILYGESLGTGVAVQMAVELAKAKAKAKAKNVVVEDSHPSDCEAAIACEGSKKHGVALLALEAPYTSTVDRGAEQYPWLPVRLLMLDQFESLAKITHIEAPLLIVHNTGDTVIPVEHGRRLYAAAKAPKRALWFRHHGHADFDWNRLAAEVERSATR